MPGAGSHKTPPDTLDPRQLVIWEDQAVLVVDKPAGLPSLPDGYNVEAPYLKGVLETVYGRLWTVHRLDRETSGVSVLARSAAAHRSLNTQFEEHRVEKTYHALATGTPDWEECEARQPLRANGDRRHRSVVDGVRGKAAHTDFTVIERLPGCTLLRATPHSGRTHQIRAHLAALGYPIAGDRLYGGKHEVNGQPASRVMLHAQCLCFAHPENGRRVCFEAAYPMDFATLLAALRG